MRRRAARQTPIAIAAATALAIATLAVPMDAGAATLYACVKSRTGAARFVSARTSCRRGERKIAWNTQGVPGRNGTNGKNGKSGTDGKNGTNGTNGRDGTNGKDGASAALVAFSDGISELPLFEHAVVTLSSIPAGNYVVIATAQLEDTNPTQGVIVHCSLAGDEAATELQAKGGTGSLSLLGALISPLTSSASLECDDFGTSGIKVSFARVAAIQVQSLSGTAG